MTDKLKIRANYAALFLITKSNGRDNLISQIKENFNLIAAKHNADKGSLVLEFEKDLVNIKFLVEDASWDEAERSGDQLMDEVFKLSGVAIENHTNNALQRFQQSQLKHQLRPFDILMTLE